MNKNLLKYGITSVAGLIVAVLITWSRGAFSPEAEIKTIVSAFCDGFFVTGMLLTLFGILVWVSGTGFFDGLTYGLQFIVQKIIPLYRQEYKSYYDYKTEKAERRYKGSTVFMMVVGLIFIGISGIILVFYYNV